MKPEEPDNSELFHYGSLPESQNMPQQGGGIPRIFEVAFPNARGFQFGSLPESRDKPTHDDDALAWYD